MLQYTNHAIKQMIARHVSDTDVQQVLRDSTTTYTQSHRDGQRRVHQRGPLAVVTDLTNTVIITVLLNSGDDWTDADVRSRK